MAPDAGNSKPAADPATNPATERDPESTLSDSELVARSLAGDESAFAALFHQHYPTVRGLAARLLLDLSLAEDVTQETFLRAARSLDQLNDPAGLRSWLFRIAANLCRDQLRSASRRATREREYADLCASEGNGDSLQAARIPAALAQLPPEHREAVVLVFYENLSHAEAARVAGCAVSTISWRLMLAKRKLKTLLQS